VAVKTPHFAAPFSFTGKSFATVEQDAKEEIRQCVLACLSTPRGSRMDQPDFGIPKHLFERISRNPNVDDYLQAIEESELRVRVLATAEVEGMIERIAFRLETGGV
jgi:phage baseplate assembly protein W